MTLRGKVADAAAAFWDFDASGRPLYVRFPTFLLRLAAAVGRDLREGHLRLRATGLVYATLLSLVPLLALGFSVLKGFGIHNQLEPFLLNLLAPFGDDAAEIAGRIIGFVENVNVGVLGVVGLGVLLFGVIALMLAIERAFNDIWRVARDRPFILRVRDYFSMILLGPLLMVVSVALTAMLRHAGFLESLVGEDALAALVAVTGEIAAWLLFVISFTALYMLMPYTRVRFFPAFAAGMITAVLWKLLGWLFSVFVAGSAQYAAIYSAFAALILFMVWLYVGWLVVLIGASVCYYLQNPSNQRLSRRLRVLSPRVREKIAMGICAEVATAFYGPPPRPRLDAQALSRGMAAPLMAVEDVLGDLTQAGILARTGPRGQEFVPGRPFDATSAGDMLALLRAVDESRGLAPGHVNVSPAALEVLAAQEKALQQALGKTMLKDLGRPQA